MLGRARLIDHLCCREAFRQQRLQAVQSVAGLFELRLRAFHRRFRRFHLKLQLGILRTADFDLFIALDDGASEKRLLVVTGGVRDGEPAEAEEIGECHRSSPREREDPVERRRGRRGRHPIEERAQRRRFQLVVGKEGERWRRIERLRS